MSVDITLSHYFVKIFENWKLKALGSLICAGSIEDVASGMQSYLNVHFLPLLNHP